MGRRQGTVRWMVIVVLAGVLVGAAIGYPVGRAHAMARWASPAFHGYTPPTEAESRASHDAAMQKIGEMYARSASTMGEGRARRWQEEELSVTAEADQAEADARAYVWRTTLAGVLIGALAGACVPAIPLYALSRRNRKPAPMR